MGSGSDRIQTQESLAVNRSKRGSGMLMDRPVDCQECNVGRRHRHIIDPVDVLQEFMCSSLYSSHDTCVFTAKATAQYPMCATFTEAVLMITHSIVFM